MREFAKRFADLTIKMREAEIAKMITVATRDSAEKKRRELIRSVEILKAGVYDVESGHVVVTDDGNISFYDDRDD